MVRRQVELCEELLQKRAAVLARHSLTKATSLVWSHEYAICSLPGVAAHAARHRRDPSEQPGPSHKLGRAHKSLSRICPGGCSFPRPFKELWRLLAC